MWYRMIHFLIFIIKKHTFIDLKKKIKVLFTLIFHYTDEMIARIHFRSLRHNHCTKKNRLIVE